MSHEEILRLQLKWINHLQTLQNKPVLIKGLPPGEDTPADVLPMKSMTFHGHKWNFYKDTWAQLKEPYFTRSILQCEIVFDPDTLIWEHMKEEYEKLTETLNLLKIPYMLTYSGGKGCHLHIFFDMHTSIPEELFDRAKKVDYDITEAVRIYLFRYIVGQAKIDLVKLKIDLPKITFQVQSMGSQIRDFGTMRAGGFCKTLIKKVPDHQPETPLPLVFPDKVELWTIPEMHKDVLIQKIEEGIIGQVEYNKEIPKNITGIGSIENIPCIAKILPGLDAGRYYGACAIALIGKELSYSWEKIEPLVSIYLSKCKGLSQDDIEIRITESENIYESTKRFSCKYIRDNLNCPSPGGCIVTDKRKEAQAVQYTPPPIEVNNIDDIPIPIEDKIPPISFDGLWPYSYHNLFKDYVASVSDGYPEYALQSGTATLSTLSRRRLYIRLNGRTEYMNLITLSLGQSGYARKGSAFSLAQRVTRAAIGDTFLSPDLTPEGMISEMADTITTLKKKKVDGQTITEEVTEEKQKGRIRKAVCAWWKDEAGQLYAQLTKPYMQSFKEQICNFYDSPEQYDKGQSAKQIHIGAISLGMNLATTPESFTRSVVNGDISTGFLARHNIVIPSYVKERKPLKEDTEDDIAMEAAFGEMLKIIDKLIPEKPIRIRIDEATLKMYDNWCKDREEYFAKERNEGMGSFFARFQINVLKTAVLIDLGNIPASLYLYKNGVDNSYEGEKIIIRHREIISKTPPLLTSNSIHVPNIIFLLNNSNISNYNISSMCLSKASLVYVMKLYDTMFIPYSYQICVNGKVDLFTNYLTNIYKNLSDKKKMERSDLMRLSNVSKRTDFDEAIETLKEAGAVLEYKVKGTTKPKTVYVYVPSPYAKLIFPQADNSGYAENGFFELTEKPDIHPKLKAADDRPKEPIKEEQSKNIRILSIHDLAIEATVHIKTWGKPSNGGLCMAKEMLMAHLKKADNGNHSIDDYEKICEGAFEVRGWATA